MKTDQIRRFYVEKVLDLYRVTPETSGVARTTDRRFAESLFDRQIPINTVYEALVLTFFRRRRPPGEPCLRPIGSLHYFQPVIDELIAQPIDQEYFEYLRYAHVDAAPRLLGAKLDLNPQIA